MILSNNFVDRCMKHGKLICCSVYLNAYFQLDIIVSGFFEFLRKLEIN